MKKFRLFVAYVACIACMVSTALAQGKLAFVTSTLPVILAGSNTTITNDATGGNGSYTWSITKGVLPAALTLCGTTGIISGVPSAPGSASIEMKVEDSSTPPQVALRPLPLVIQPDAPLFTQPLPQSAKVGVAFSCNFTATGGKAPYKWTTSSSLPVGMTLDAATGVLSGTANANANPNTAQAYAISVTVTGNNSQLQVKSFTLTVNPSDAPTITTTTLSPNAELGVVYSAVVTASGGGGNYTFQNLSPMPLGLTLNPDGSVTGTPSGTAAQDVSVKVKVTDGVNRSSEAFVRIRVVSASVPTITSSSPLPQGAINTPYTFVLQATGGRPPYVWSMPSESGSSGRLNLPPGLILSANGTISGTPTKGGSFDTYPRVTDANGKETIKQLTIVLIDSTFAIVGDGISSNICGNLNQRYSTINGKAPYAWTLTGAPSSSSVTINASTGVVTGGLTSVVPGNYTLTLSVRDSLGQNATASKTLTVLVATPLSWANTSSPVLGAASEGAAYSAKVQINGGRPPYQYVLKSGSSLPPSLTLNASTGEIKGTPTTPGNYAFTITASDSCTGTSIDETFTLVVDSLAVVCKPIIQNKCSTVSYTGATVTGGVSPYAWTTTTALPASLVMNPTTGKIQGQLTAAAGNLTIIVQATDKNGKVATGPLNITINPVPPLTWLSPVSPLNLGDAYNSSVYNAVLTLSGGVTPYNFALKAGSALPAGLTLNSTTGKISGTPTSTGNTTFTIVATESSCDKLSTEGVFNLNVLDPLALTGSTITGNKCSSIAPAQMTLTGGAAPFKWIVSPALPSALSINQTTGVVSGNLTSNAGNYTVGVTVTDKNGKTATAPMGITILALPTFAWVTTANLTDGYKSSAYSTTLSVTGGIAPYTLSLKSGNLTTAGLSFNATTGVISGTPTAAGNYTFTITAKESSCDGLSIERAFKLQVFDPVIIGGPSISGNKCSSVIGANYTVSGGAPPFTWSTVPTLPASMSINATTGRISGNLTTGAGSYSIQATDRNGRVATKAITITINALPTFTWLSTANLTDGYKTSAYSTQLSVTGGIAPYTFSLKSGSSLPGGLTLNSTTGIISGTPTAAGTYTFTVVALESSCDGLSIERTFRLQVYDPIAISGSPISGIKCNAITPTSFPVTGGAAPITWSTTPSPIVPSGLSINATTGVISGVVSGNAGSYIVAVKATDKNLRTVTYTSNITITNPTLTWITSANLPDGYETTNYSTLLSVSGVTPPYQYSLTGGTLPNNLTLNGTTGVISGNLTTAGNYTFTIRAQDACGRVTDRSFTLRVGKNGILECLKEIWVDVDYDNITYTGHTCDRADFEIKLMSTSVMIANLNNTRGVGTLVNGIWLQRDYMGYPQNTWPNTFRGRGNTALGESSSSSSRYNRVLIDNTLLESVASSYNGSTTIPVYATTLYTLAHGSAARLRVYTNKAALGFASATKVHEGPINGGVAVLVNLQCPSSTTPALQLMAIPSAASKNFAVKMLVVDPTSSLTNLSASDHTKAEHLIATPFLIGRTEATNQEYCDFLNAVAKQSDSRGLYNVAMSSDLNGGIERAGNAGAYAYSVKAGMGNYPVVHVSWFDAVRYVNWLSNGSPTGAQDKTTTEDGAYALNGAVSGAGIARNATNPNTTQNPKYWLLNESEWHTSAYLKTSKQTAVSFWSYPTQSDADPDLTLGNIKNLANCGNIFTGPTEAGFFGESYGPFGTLDQGGNVREWTESVDSVQYRIIRGGSWADSAEAMKASESDVADPTLEDDKTGFRIGGAP